MGLDHLEKFVYSTKNNYLSLSNSVRYIVNEERKVVFSAIEELELCLAGLKKYRDFRLKLKMDYIKAHTPPKIATGASYS